MYKIIGKYQGTTEEIDSADTREAAETLLVEYRMAFGPNYTLWIKKSR